MKAYVDILGHDRPGVTQAEVSQNNSQPIRAVNHGRGYTGAAAENGCSLRVPASRVANGGPIDSLGRHMIPVAATTGITATATQNLNGEREKNYIKEGRHMLKVPRLVAFIWGFPRACLWLCLIPYLEGLNDKIAFTSVDTVAKTVDRLSGLAIFAPRIPDAKLRHYFNLLSEGTAPPTNLISAHLLGCGSADHWATRAKYDPLSGHRPQGDLCKVYGVAKAIKHPIIFAFDRIRLPYDHTCPGSLHFRPNASPPFLLLFRPRVSDCVPGSTYMLDLKEPTSTIQAFRRKSMGWEAAPTVMSINGGGAVRIVVREDPRRRIQNPWRLAASWRLHDRFSRIPPSTLRLFLPIPYLSGGTGSGGGAIRLILRLDRGLEMCGLRIYITTSASGGGGLAVCMCQRRYEGWPVRPGVTVADPVRHARGPAPTGSASFGNTCHKICPTLGAHLLNGVVKRIDKGAVPTLETVTKERYRYKD
ncbi:hypothetical protein An17g00480 [Aspergillus niger]|uniref:Uncharacterized protein n=2 Tax=Aspergillus niger TaxID=5061 RepID=A2R985_ASPNC|nr:hypothetical protein An17g00480 [Aspergillus niger]CAK97408.1 hypothetical protein An17g00480 [Aspergillus niger]